MEQNTACKQKDWYAIKKQQNWKMLLNLLFFFIFIRSNVMKKQYEENITKGLLYINTISRFPSNTTNKIVKNIEVDRNDEK